MKGDADLITLLLANRCSQITILRDLNGDRRLFFMEEVLVELDRLFPGQSSSAAMDLSLLSIMRGNDYLGEVLHSNWAWRNYVALRRARAQFRLVVARADGEVDIDWRCLGEVLEGSRTCAEEDPGTMRRREADRRKAAARRARKAAARAPAAKATADDGGGDEDDGGEGGPWVYETVGGGAEGQDDEGGPHPPSSSEPSDPSDDPSGSSGSSERRQPSSRHPDPGHPSLDEGVISYLQGLLWNLAINRDGVVPDQRFIPCKDFPGAAAILAPGRVQRLGPIASSRHRRSPIPPPLPFQVPLLLLNPNHAGSLPEPLKRFLLSPPTCNFYRATARPSDFPVEEVLEASLSLIPELESLGRRDLLVHGVQVIYESPNSYNAAQLAAFVCPRAPSKFRPLSKPYGVAQWNLPPEALATAVRPSPFPQDDGFDLNEARARARAARPAPLAASGQGKKKK